MNITTDDLKEIRRSLRGRAEFWRNNQNDPHNIGNAVQIALQEVSGALLFAFPASQPEGESIPVKMAEPQMRVICSNCGRPIDPHAWPTSGLLKYVPTEQLEKTLDSFPTNPERATPGLEFQRNEIKAELRRREEKKVNPVFKSGKDRAIDELCKAIDELIPTVPTKVAERLCHLICQVQDWRKD